MSKRPIFKISLIFSVFSLFIIGSITAQDQILISQEGIVEACSGAFLDSGAAAGGYGPNESYTITICPETEGDVIYVEFLSADILCPNNGNCDQLEVFDGDSNGANSMGTVSGPITFTASPLNTTGCLTFQFTSNGTDEGNGWNSILSCETPCDRPEAIASTDPGGEFPIKLCVGEEINFDGSASTVADGQVIEEWLWDFKDGTTDDSGPIVSHSYDQPGEYIVQLYLIDDNDCASTNRTDIQIWVSTYPNFEFDFPFGTSTCLGDTLGINCDVEAIPVTWDAQPTVDFGGGVLVPDIVGECFESTIEFNGFSPGQTLTDIEDLEDIYVNFEHSFMGDLLIQIICPDGTTVNLHEQGGGGTNLGEANQADDGVPGTGWDYWWADDATNGTWEEESVNAVDNILPSDTYSTVGNLEDLVGCPLNGIWSLSMCDLWGADDGYVFEWAINFNPDLYPELTQFTPTYGGIDGDADSTYWSGDYIEFSDPGLDTILVVPDEVGEFEYTYFAVNDFGCESDSTVILSIYQAQDAFAGEDFIICGDDNVLDGGLLGANTNDCSADAGTYEYCYSNWDWNNFSFCPDDPGSEMMTIEFLSGELQDGIDVIQVYNGDNFGAPLLGEVTGDVAGQVFTADNPSGCLMFNLVADGGTSCADGSFDQIVYEVYCGGPYDYNWTPMDLVSDATDPNAEVLEIPSDGIFTLEAYPTGHPACATTDEVVVSPAFTYTWDSSNPSCFGNDGWIEVFIDASGGGGPWEIEFYEDDILQMTEDSDGGTTTFSDLFPGNYSLKVIGGNCIYDITSPIEAPDPVLFEVVEDFTICIDGTAELTAWSEDDPDDSWTYTWDNDAGIGSSVDVTPVVTTVYSVFATDDFGCDSDPMEVEIEVNDSISFNIPTDTLICIGGEVNLEITDVEGGAGPYTYTWDYDGALVGSAQQVTYEPNNFAFACATVNDACETPEVSHCFLVEIEEDVEVLIASDKTTSCPPGYFNFSIPVDPELYVNTIWDMGNGHNYFDETEFEETYPNPGTYDVALTLISEIGCEYYGTFDNYITVYNPPKANFSATPQPTRIPDTDISFTDLSIGDIVSWEYVFDTLNVLGTASIPNPTFQFPYNVAGDYPVTLTVVDNHGCTDQHTGIIFIDDLFNLFVPNSFTPNADGVNDVFFVQGTDIDPEKYSLEIFNRWGQKVHETTDLNDTWEGETLDGDYYYVQDNVYTWRIVVYSITTAERQEMVGTVTVFR